MSKAKVLDIRGYLEITLFKISSVDCPWMFYPGPEVIKLFHAQLNNLKYEFFPAHKC